MNAISSLFLREIAMESAAIALGSALGIAAAFHAGLESIEKKDYEKAIRELTVVVETNAPFADMKDAALLWRATVFADSGHKEEALKDLASAISLTRRDDVRASAILRYAELGGDPATLRPKQNPAETAQAFFDLLRKDSVDEARAMIGPPLRDLINLLDAVFAGEMGGGNTFLGEMADACDKVQIGEPVYDDRKREASLPLIIEGGTVTVGLSVNDGRWIFTTIRSVAPPDRNVRVQASRGGMMGDLPKLRDALFAYAQQHDGNFPGKLSELPGAEDGAFSWIDPATGKREDLLYCPGLTENHPAATIMAATPASRAGMRWVLRVDGSFDHMAEADFIESARAQKWKLPGAVREDDVSREIQGEIAALIKQLGDGDPGRRAAARKALEAMGPATWPFLEKELDNPDPEISMSVRELLGRSK